MDEPKPTERMIIPSLSRLGDVLSEIIGPHTHKPFFQPYAVRIPEDYRRAHCVQLMKCLGPRYATCDFDGFCVHEETAENRLSQRQVFAEVRAFASNMVAKLKTGGGIILFGRPGTGKDHLLVALAYWAILEYGFEVKWVDGRDLMQQARDLINEPHRSERDFIQAYQREPILIISDPLPPKGDASAYAADVLQRIVDRRYRDLRSTWITANVHDGSEAERRLASSIIDRLRHDSLCLECNWESYRSPADPDRRKDNL